jgi:hypothetical protein
VRLWLIHSSGFDRALGVAVARHKMCTYSKSRAARSVIKISFRSYMYKYIYMYIFKKAILIQYLGVFGIREAIAKN